MTPPGPLGHIAYDDRTELQHEAAAEAQADALRIRKGFTFREMARGDKIILTDAWSHPDVQADLGGRPYIRELQNTGSCVKVGGTNALRCTIAAQRLVSDSSITAFEPFCWHNYADSRHRLGDDGQGEGSMGSTFAQSLNQLGCRDWPQVAGDILPDFTKQGQHFSIPAAQEMEWSSYRSPKVQQVIKDPTLRKLGSAAAAQSSADIMAMVQNGYAGGFACDRFIGNGHVTGSGDGACVVGKWDHNGGHQQWFFGVWHHPSLGYLVAIGNNWADETYPQDPAGLPLCCVWVAVADVDAAFRYHAEVYGYSHQDWLPAAPKAIDWDDIWRQP
jgi:hypothetical protein